MAKFSLDEYTNGTDKLLKNIITKAYYTIFYRIGYDSDELYSLERYFQDGTFKKYGVIGNIPELWSYEQNNYPNKAKKLNQILNFTWIDENDTVDDLKNLPDGVGEIYKDLDLKNKKIGNYDLNIINHQQGRIDSFCDKIKNKEIEVTNKEAEKYFLIKFTLQAMYSRINNQIKEIENKGVNSCFYIVDFIKSQTNDGKNL